MWRNPQNNSSPSLFYFLSFVLCSPRNTRCRRHSVVIHVTLRGSILGKEQKFSYSGSVDGLEPTRYLKPNREHYSQAPEILKLRKTKEKKRKERKKERKKKNIGQVRGRYARRQRHCGEAIKKGKTRQREEATGPSSSNGLLVSARGDELSLAY